MDIDQPGDPTPICPPPSTRPKVLEVQGLSVAANGRRILKEVVFDVRQNQVYGLIGPSGVGKSTLLRCVNRLIDLQPEFRVEGDIVYEGDSIFSRRTDPDLLRMRIGMLFQQPVVFPKSIFENVLFGVKRVGDVPRKQWPEVAEESLREVALWDEVKDRLEESALELSVGQQQRLCLARALALQPHMLLMDEPTSALDPRSTRSIETLIQRLKEKHAVLIVTHNIDQARRITDWVGCLCFRDGCGQLVEDACCDRLLQQPTCQEVVEYLGLKK